MKKRLASCLLAATLASGVVAAAPTPPHRSVYKPALVLQWKDRLHVANERLQQADWKQGRDIADAVLREMRDRIVSGEASGDMLAVPLLFRAIGEAGLNDAEAAAWDFGTAQSLYPDYERVDLKAYGAAGALLDRFRYQNGEPPDPTGLPPTDGTTERQVKPPRKVRGNSPEYPLAKAEACVQHAVVVSTIINEQGRTESPGLPAAADPVLALAALDAVRTWRFEPARVDGKPVAVTFLLTVNFKVRQCY